MACGGCKKGGGNRHTSTGGDLRQFAYLTPRQLKIKKQQEEQIKAAEAIQEDQ